jgi:hypothetical protein
MSTICHKRIPYATIVFVPGPCMRPVKTATPFGSVIDNSRATRKRYNKTNLEVKHLITKSH